MLLIACGIKRVVAEYKYHSGSEAEEMMQQAGIQSRRRSSADRQNRRRRQEPS